MGYTLFINTKMEVKLTFSYKKRIPIVPKKALYRKRYISQLPRSSKNKKEYKMCSLQIHLGTQLLGNLLLFSTSRWRICPGCHYVGGAGGLGSGTCLAHSSSALSLSALEASLYLILWWNSGPPRADLLMWMLQNPSGSGWLFLSLLLGASHIGLTVSYSDLIASLDQRSQVPDDCTETTEEKDAQLESSAWSLLSTSYSWAVAFLSPVAWVSS